MLPNMLLSGSVYLFMLFRVMPKTLVPFKDTEGCRSWFGRLKIAPQNERLKIVAMSPFKRLHSLHPGL